MADQESQGGLSYVSDGAPAPAESQLIPTRTTIQVGGSKFPVAAGIDSSTILKNLQEELDRRQAAMPSDFMHGLTKAAAFSLGRPDVAASVDAQRQNQLNQLYNMRMQGEAFRAAQAQQERAMQGFSSENPNAIPAASSLGQGQGAAPAQGTAPVQGAAPVQGLDQYSGIPNNIKRELYAQTQAEIAQGADPVQATAKYHASLNKLRDELVKSATDYAHNPELKKPQNYTVYDENGAPVPMTIPLERYESLPETFQSFGKTYFKSPMGSTTAVQPPPPPSLGTGAPSMTGTIRPVNIGAVESHNTPGAVGPLVAGQGRANGEMQTMGATERSPGFGVRPANLTGEPVNDEAERKRVGTEYFNAMKSKYGNDSYAAAAYNWGPGNMDAWVKAGANPDKMPASVRDYVAKAHLYSAVQGLPYFMQPTAGQNQQVSAITPVQPSIANTAITTPNVIANPRTPKEVEANISAATKAAEANIDVAKQAKEQELKDALAMSTSWKNQAVNIDDGIARAQRLKDAAVNKPYLFQWEKNPQDVSSYGQQAAKALFGGKAQEEGIQGLRQLAQNQVRPDFNQDLDTATGDAKQLAFIFGADKVKEMSARGGIGFQKMADQAKSIGPANSAKTTYLNAGELELGLRRTKALSEAYSQYEAEARARGETPNAFSFMETAPAKTIAANYTQKLQQLNSDANTIFAKSKNAPPPLSAFPKKKD